MSDFFSGMFSASPDAASAAGDAGLTSSLASSATDNMWLNPAADSLNYVTDVTNSLPTIPDSLLNNALDAGTVAGVNSDALTSGMTNFGDNFSVNISSPDVWAGNATTQGASVAGGASGGDVPGGFSDAGTALDTANASGAGLGALGGAGGGSSGIGDWWGGLSADAKKFVWGGLSMGAKSALSMFANPNRESYYLASKYRTDEQAREFNQARSDRERAHIPSLSPGIVNSAMGS